MPPPITSGKMFTIGIVMAIVGLLFMIGLDTALGAADPFMNLSLTTMINAAPALKQICFVGGLAFIAMSFLVKNFEYDSGNNSPRSSYTTDG